MLDSDLADLYGVSTKRLNQQVRRNAARFPSDFMLQLTAEEVDNLRSQIVTSSVRLRIGSPWEAWRESLHTAGVYRARRGDAVERAA